MNNIIYKLLKELSALRKHNKSGDQYRASKSIEKLETLLKLLQLELKNIL